tara:strand:- start:842 stop:1207 length:366 start_codon:yes stop_codon:yes gene_type:complete
MKLKNKNLKKIICFDIDNVICRTKGKDYKRARPNIIGIKKINKLFEKGYVIKLYTARFMGRNNDNISKAKKQGYEMTKNQLKRWKIKYHKLVFGKTSFDLFIDDKSMYFKKKWHIDIDKYL